MLCIIFLLLNSQHYQKSKSIIGVFGQAFLKAHYSWREKTIVVCKHTSRKSLSITAIALFPFLSSRSPFLGNIPRSWIAYLFLFPILQSHYHQSISIWVKNCKYVSFFICFLEIFRFLSPMLKIIAEFWTGVSVIRSSYLRNQCFKNSPIHSSLLAESLFKLKKSIFHEPNCVWFDLGVSYYNKVKTFLFLLI